MALNLLLRDLQADTATIAFSELAPLAHELEQDERLARPAGVNLLLGLGVAELGPAAHLGPYHLRRQRLTAMVQGDRPQQRGPDFIRKQAGRTFAEHRRMERSSAVGGI